VIIAGDWNVVQDYRGDTVNYIGENNPKSKLEIHQMINSMDLASLNRLLLNFHVPLPLV
jgi:hypothetical protein